LNDLLRGRAPEDIVADIDAWKTVREAAGWSVSVCTLPAAPVWGRPDQPAQQPRLALNALIRSTFGSGCDPGADPFIGDAWYTPKYLTFFNLDGIHMTDVGYARLAGVINQTPPPETAIEAHASGLVRDGHLTCWLRDMMRADEDLVEPWYNMMGPATGAFDI